jgi:zinc transport system substrate-binding protein
VVRPSTLTMPSFLQRISKNPEKRHAAALFVALLVLPGTLLPGLEPPARTGPKVVCSYYPLHIFALNVMDGTRGPAPTLLLEPAGGCAHGVSLRPAQVARLRSATAVIETGLGLEPFLEDARFRPDGPFVRIATAAELGEADLLALDGHEGHDHDHEDESTENFNGHAWTSPRLAARMVRTMGHALGEIDPTQADRYVSNAEGYAARLESLHGELRELRPEFEGRRVVLSHTSLAYLARELGLEVIATLRDEDENDPRPRELARMIDKLKRTGIEAILYDPQDSGRLAMLVARETGCDRLILLDPAASGPLEARAYESIQRVNLERLRAWAEQAPLIGASMTAGAHPTEASATRR